MSVAIIKKKFLTLHGHGNVKKKMKAVISPAASHCHMSVFTRASFCRLCDIQAHVETTHSSSVLARSQAAEATWELTQAECYQNSHHVLFCYGEAFLLHKRFDIPQRKLYMTVHHCWEVSSVFRYSLQLEKNCGKQSALFSNVVHSASEAVEQVLLSGEAIRVDFDMLMNFVKGTRTVRITATDK